MRSWRKFKFLPESACPFASVSLQVSLLSVMCEYVAAGFLPPLVFSFLRSLRRANIIDDSAGVDVVITL